MPKIFKLKVYSGRLSISIVYFYRYQKNSPMPLVHYATHLLKKTKRENIIWERGEQYAWDLNKFSITVYLRGSNFGSGCG